MRAEVPSIPSKILILGDCLTAEEMNEGKIFSGASGRLLNSMLRHAGLRREELYLTNVFMSRPKNDRIEEFFLTRSAAKKEKFVSGFPIYGTKGYLRPEFEENLARVKAEITLSNPTLIVALGPVALWALTGQFKISKMRGVVLPCTLVPGKKVLGTYHSEVVRKDFSSRPIVITDLSKAKEEAEFPDIKRVTRSLWICDKVSDLAIFEKMHMLKSSGFAADVETEAAQVTHISIAPSPQAALVIPIWEHGVSYWSEDEELEIRLWLWRVMRDRRWTKTFQNALYDLTYCHEEGFPPWGRCEDIMLMHHAQHIELPKDLGTLGSLYCNEIAWKTFRAKPIKDISKKEE